jgi:geranylgeranyl pyrophosphate synthase
VTAPALPGDDDVVAYLGELRAIVEPALDRTLAALASPAPLADALRYALLGGGKRLRPCLTLAAADAAGASLGLPESHRRALALPAACAVEMVHTYSLVHDDLPAMDDDALRRGRPTSHVVYGDGLAVLAGDGLLTEAFHVLTASPPPGMPAGAPEPAADRRVEAVRRLARAAGAAGMVGGQAIDLAAAGRVRGQSATRLTADSLEDMHRRKTGALIRAAATMGAVVVGADRATVDAVDAYARDLGLAYQIVDDILDVEGSDAALGKTAGKDAAAGKPTYPAFYGLDASRRLATDCIARAQATLTRAGLGGRLSGIAAWSLTRRG